MNKQIEEMAKEIRKYICVHLNCQCCECEELRAAERLYAAGYRKASDVAEQFKEIAKQYLLEKGLYLAVFKNALNHAEAELKTKYESEGADDER